MCDCVDESYGDGDKRWPQDYILRCLFFYQWWIGLDLHGNKIVNRKAFENFE